jgi:hypothetical protein
MIYLSLSSYPVCISYQNEVTKDSGYLMSWPPLGAGTGEEDVHETQENVLL